MQYYVSHMNIIEYDKTFFLNIKLNRISSSMEGSFVNHNFKFRKVFRTESVVRNLCEFAILRIIIQVRVMILQYFSVSCMIMYMKR